MDKEQYLKKLCDQFQSTVKGCPDGFYETARNVRKAMGDKVANEINKGATNNNPFPTEWVSFKFATLIIPNNSSWVKETNISRKKRAEDAISLLGKLEEIISVQIGRWSEDGHYQKPYPLYFDGREDLSNLQKIKVNQKLMLNGLQHNPLKNYHIAPLDRVCSQAVGLAEHFGFGKSSSKTPKGKGMSEAFSPIERMVKVILPGEDSQRIKSAIEAARKRMDRETPEEVYLISESQKRLKAKRYGQN